VVILVASAIVVLLSIGLREETDEPGRHGGRNFLQLTRSSLHHFYRHDRLRGPQLSAENAFSTAWIPRLSVR
jgi:hypothetical protein